MQTNQNQFLVVDDHVPSSGELSDLARQVGASLKARSWQCATAESCTGGWVAKLITDVAGSSNWFLGGYVCYANACKQNMLGVSATLIQQYGAVSSEIVMSLSEGVLARTQADIAVAVSGVAGPGGGTDEKPVGTVWIAWCVAEHQPECRHFRFAGSREAIRAAAAGQALRGILIRAK